MIFETVDLYAYFKIPRSGNCGEGGYLAAYARTRVNNIAEKLRPAMLVIPAEDTDIFPQERASLSRSGFWRKDFLRSCCNIA